MIDRYSSETNTKVYGDGSENFKHFFFFSYLEMSRASDNTKASMKKKKYSESTPFSLM